MKVYHTYTAVDIAFVLLKSAKGRGLSFSNLQLQKLAYICHGISLSRLERPLFIEDVYAWQYGPVVPSIYFRFRDFGADPVTETVEEVELDADSLHIVQSVVEKFGQLSPWQLVKLTHREGSPWQRVWSEKERSVIPDEVIKAHYDEIYRQGTTNAL